MSRVSPICLHAALTGNLRTHINPILFYPVRCGPEEHNDDFMRRSPEDVEIFAKAIEEAYKLKLT
eukprot:1406488-Rhodomonas_salina.2